MICFQIIRLNNSDSWCLWIRITRSLLQFSIEYRYRALCYSCYKLNDLVNPVSVRCYWFMPHIFGVTNVLIVFYRKEMPCIHYVTAELRALGPNWFLNKFKWAPWKSLRILHATYVRVCPNPGGMANFYCLRPWSMR